MNIDVEEKLEKEAVSKHLPCITKKFYDEKGKCCGFSMLVSQGELPITGKQFAEFLRAKDLE